MDRRSGALEDLPPLELRPLRGLDLDAPPPGGGQAHLAAASGVVRRGDFVYVVGDDQVHLGVFRLSDPGPGTLRRVLPGDLPADPGDRKAVKPDLEALTVLPPFEEHPFGALLGLGSGSAPGRDRGFTVALEADGSLRGDAAVLDLGPLYDHLAGHVEALNVEGACVVGERLWILHRGSPGETTNVVAEVPLADLMGTLTGARRLDVPELSALRTYELGALDGVELTFSDATPLGRDLLVFTASAEGDDGIRGSVVGTIDPEGEVHRLRTIDRRYKVEGVHASVDTGVVDFLFVCDQDDPEQPAPLLSAAMPLDGRFEAPGTAG